jgi:hypothetical protein
MSTSSPICPAGPVAVCTDPSGCHDNYKGTQNTSYSGCGSGTVCCMLPGSNTSTSDTSTAAVGADNGASLTLERLQKEYQQVLQQYTQATQVTSTEELTPDRRSLWNQLQARLHQLNDAIQQNVMLSGASASDNAVLESDHLTQIQQEYDALMLMKKQEAETEDSMLPVDREKQESGLMVSQKYASYKWLYVVMLVLIIIYLRVLGVIQPSLTLFGFVFFISVVCTYFFYRSFMMLAIVMGLLVLAFTLPLPFSEPLMEGPSSSDSGFGSGGYGNSEFY